MITAYLALGSNLGDRMDTLVQAVRLLDTPVVKLAAVSSVFETAPQGVTDQPVFLNMVVAVQTSLSPMALLAHTQGVEQQMGRIRRERWGPRTLDVDIVLYGDERVDAESLTIPHPRMTERAFVLVPLLELAPGARLPGDPRPLQAYLDLLPDQGVRVNTPAASFQEYIRGVQ